MSGYQLSRDGLAVVTATTVQPISASSFNSTLLSGYSSGSGHSYTSNIGNDGTIVDLSDDPLDIPGMLNGSAIDTEGTSFTAYYASSNPLPAGSYLQWIQVVTCNVKTDDTIDNRGPFLDNVSATNPGAISQPFYADALGNNASLKYRDAFLNSIPNSIDFFDRSARFTSDVNLVGAVNWTANLYPVIVKGDNITIENGLSWGWTMQKATVGTDSGVFVDPSTDGDAFGVNTSFFSTGDGDSSSISFSGTSYNTNPETNFKLGTLTFHNGVNTSAVSSVTLSVTVNLQNDPDAHIVFQIPITLLNTPNTDDPVASADIISLPSIGYSLSVEEGATASVDLYGMLSPNLSGLSALVTGAGAADSAYVSSEADQLNSATAFQASATELTNPSAGGVVSAVPAQIDGFYRDILGRPLTGSEYINWANVLAEPGQTLDTVRAAIAASPEAAAAVNNLYQAVLSRVADPNGLAGWQAFLGQPGQSLSTVQADLAASPEAAGAINNLYQSTLSRPADPGGLASFQQLLAQPGQSLSTVQADLAASSEAAAAINTLYLSTLGRQADPGGLALFQQALAQPGQSLGTIQADLAASPEAASDINGLYQSVLGRQADSGGLASFQQFLAMPGQSLATVRADLAASPEAAADIQQIYQGTAGRAATPTQVSADVAKLNSSTIGTVLQNTFFYYHAGQADDSLSPERFIFSTTQPDLFEINFTGSTSGRWDLVNFNPAIDLIGVNTNGFSTNGPVIPTAVSGINDTSSGVVVSFANNSSLLIENVSSNQLTVSNFLISAHR